MGSSDIDPQIQARLERVDASLAKRLGESIAENGRLRTEIVELRSQIEKLTGYLQEARNRRDQSK